MKSLYEQFIKERRIYSGVSPKTVLWYRGCWKAFGAVFEQADPATLDRHCLLPRIEALLGGGVSTTSINTYLRGIRAFLRWCNQEGITDRRVHVPRLKEEEKLVSVWSLDDIRTLYAHRPESFAEERCRAIALLILDTGLRISEALSLRGEDVSFDDLLLTVKKGKGGKQRVVPISIQGRKLLRAYMRAHPPLEGPVFAAQGGGRCDICNVRSDFARLCRLLRISHDKGGWHILRHTFATHFVRNQGDLISLQRILGHSNLEVTKRYIAMEVTQIQAAHARCSVLVRL